MIQTNKEWNDNQGDMIMGMTESGMITKETW